MKKYVSKEDVKKGLVDPKKPLNQQKEYLEKIEKQEREKNPNKDKQEHQGDQYRRKQRENKPKYNWNRRDVKEDTPIPDAPKKQVPKPDKEKFFNQLNAFKKQIQQLNEKKSSFINELKSTLRNTSQNKKNTQTVKTKYSHILRQKRDLKKLLQQDMKTLQQTRDEAEKQFNSIKDKISGFKKPEHFEDCSKQELQRRLEKTQQKLTIAQLDKKQQNRINMKISQIKRAIQKSRSQIQINVQLDKLQDQSDFLFKHLKQIKAKISQKYAQLREVKDEIGKINEDLSNEKTEPEDVRTHQEIKTDFDTKIQEVNKQKTVVKQKIQKLRQAYAKSQDDYDDYSDLVAYIKMVKQQKEKIKSWKQEQQRRKKEKQEEEKKRQKQYQQRQKRRQQKLQRDQQRKKQNEQKKQKLQKQREQYINRNPNHEKIEICNSLIDYCESLKPENASRTMQKREQKVVQPITELKPTDSKDWEKQLKKGAQVIVSKKLKQDEDVPKKVPKEKKKKEKQVTESTSGFTHHYETAKRFDRINMLPPLTAAEVDETIKQLKDRIELFNKPTEQQIKVYKQKAERQFDSLHGFGHEDRGRKSHYKEKNGGHEEDRHEQQHAQPVETKEKEKQKPKSKRFEQKEVVANQSEFPGLN